MLDAVPLPSLIRRPAAGAGFTWRTRVLPDSRTRTGLTLAIDVHGRVDWAPRGDRRVIRARTLRLCAHLADVALSEGFWAELLPARPCDDPGDACWICVARLRLTLRLEDMVPPDGGACPAP